MAKGGKGSPLPKLTKLLGSSCRAVQEQAWGAIRNLALGKTNQEKLGAMDDFLQELTKLLGSRRLAVQEQAAWLVWSLAHVEKNHEKLRKMEDLRSKLASLYRSPCQAVQQQAAAAMEKLDLSVQSEAPTNKKLERERLRVIV